MFDSVGSLRFEPRLSAENRHKVGLHGKNVAKISGVANDPMGGAFAMEMNRSPTPARDRIAAMTTAELRSNVLRLPTEERAALARDLIASLDARTPIPTPNPFGPSRSSAARARWQMARWPWSMLMKSPPRPPHVFARGLAGEGSATTLMVAPKR